MEFLNEKLKCTVMIGTIMMVTLFMGCQQPDSVRMTKRYASVTGLKEDKIEVYKQLHAAAWPAVLKKIKECNIQNYSIYLKKIDGKNYLFSYFEYVGDDFELDMKKMGEDPETKRWWKETDPCQIPLAEASSNGAIWSDMDEVFHTD